MAIFAWPDRRELRALLRRFGYSGWHLLEPLAALGLIALFVKVYFALLTPLGLITVSYLDSYLSHGWPLWLAFLLTCGGAAVIEEVAFRGFVYGRLKRIGGPGEALVVQAIMFSVLHLLPTIFISHFVIGLVLGLLRQRSGSLLPGILVHAAWNAIVLVEEMGGAG